MGEFGYQGRLSVEKNAPDRCLERDEGLRAASRGWMVGLPRPRGAIPPCRAQAPSRRQEPWTLGGGRVSVVWTELYSESFEGF